MRPIDRGEVPLDDDGQAKSVTDYKHWRLDLINRIGEYCSYCNMPLHDSPQVEHVVPKNPQPGEEEGDLLAWENMVLACGPCNRAKSNHPNSPNTHYLPDAHNTHLAFEYVLVEKGGRKPVVGCIPKAADAENVDTGKSEATITLCNLDAIDTRNTASDLRWRYRYEAALNARLQRKIWDQLPPTVKALWLQTLGELIKKTGFFSIWYREFHNEPAVLRVILEAFPGTHMRSFSNDSLYTPRRRRPGDL